MNKSNENQRKFKRKKLIFFLPRSDYHQKIRNDRRKYELEYIHGLKYTESMEVGWVVVAANRNQEGVANRNQEVEQRQAESVEEVVELLLEEVDCNRLQLVNRKLHISVNNKIKKQVNNLESNQVFKINYRLTALGLSSNGSNRPRQT